MQLVRVIKCTQPHTLEFLTGNKRLFLGFFLAVEKVRNRTVALSFHATKPTAPDLPRVNAFWKEGQCWC